MAKSTWANDWTVGVHVRIEHAGQAVLGEGRAELLSAIDRERSITKAAKAMGMSYRRAWTMIQEINAAAGETLVVAAVGGKRGGGARLTDQGRLRVAVYEQVRQSLIETAAGALRQTIGQNDSNGSSCVHLAAAISLQEAVGQILAEFALRQPAVRVRAIFGASNELADHLLAGAPGDLFIAAEPAELDRLDAAKLLVAGSRRRVAENGLAIVGSAKSEALKKVGDLLAKRFKRVALAEAACPLGQYSKRYLQKARVYEALLQKAMHVDNSRAVLAAVVSGAADVGVAFSSDAASGGAWHTLLRVPASQAAATYAAAIVRRGRRRQDAKTLLDFFSSPTGARCLRRCGLRPVKPGVP
jgi:molybdenum ABC transporter molybdate-binding protein